MKGPYVARRSANSLGPLWGRDQCFIIRQSLGRAYETSTEALCLLCTVDSEVAPSISQVDAPHWFRIISHLPPLHLASHRLSRCRWSISMGTPRTITPTRKPDNASFVSALVRHGKSQHMIIDIAISPATANFWAPLQCGGRAPPHRSLRQS